MPWLVGRISGDPAHGGIVTGTAVMVHGAGGGGWEWTIWAHVFTAAGIAVHAHDLLPCATGIADTCFDDYRSQVLAASRAAASPLILVGASLGGLVAIAAANSCSPAALILVNPVPPAGVMPRPAIVVSPPVIEWSRSNFASTRRALPDADVAIARWMHRRWRDESGRIVDEAVAGIELATPRCPILVVASENDVEIPLSLSRSTARALGADFVTIAGASHLGVLMGRSASSAATLAVSWLNVRRMLGNTA